MTEEEASLFAQTDRFKENFEKAMDDDFNTADDIAAIFDFVKFINTNASGNSTKEYLGKLHERLAELSNVLGIIVDKKEEMLDAEIEKMIEERQA